MGGIHSWRHLNLNILSRADALAPFLASTTHDSIFIRDDHHFEANSQIQFLLRRQARYDENPKQVGSTGMLTMWYSPYNYAHKRCMHLSHVLL